MGPDSSRRRIAWGALPLIALASLTSCRACERTTAAPADAQGPRDARSDSASDAQSDPPSDAATGTTPARSELSPIAIASSGSRLHTLADREGSILYSHGLTIDRLHDDGRREHITTLRAPLDDTLEEAPMGTIGGTLEDGLFASVILDHYPAGAVSKSFRLRTGAEPERILGDDVFYLGVSRWNDGRLLALRATGAVRWFHYTIPWTVDRFVVLSGSPQTAPQIPPKTFIEGFVAFDSGTVLAAATTFDIALVDRRGAEVLRWTREGGAPRIDRPPSNEADRVEHVAARREDDVWLAGRTSETDLQSAWLQHWNGREWKREDAPFEGWVKSISVAPDGTLWAISNGMIGRARNALYRRSAANAWTRVDLPDLDATTFAKPPPRIGYVGRELRIDRRRAPLEKRARATLEPVQVVARGPDVIWVVAQVETEGRPTSVLLRVGGPPASIADLDEDEATFADDKSTPANPKCISLFVSGGEPTERALNRVKASAASSSNPIVIARLDGKRVIGSTVDSLEAAEDLASTWRKLALPAEIRCARPPIVELIVDPSARDD